MDYKSVIESRYNREAWEALLHDIFLSGANFRTTPIPVDAHSPLVSESLQLGTITLKDDNKIAVYEIKLSNSVDIVENRVGIRNLLFSDWKFKGCAGAFIFCYRDNESVLRFSYVSQTFAFGEDGKMAKEETDTKRFTYILGEGHRSRTAIGQFENLKSSSQTLKDLTKAFSLDAVSDRFFDDYKEVYEDIVEYVTGKRYVKVANKWEEKIIHAPNEIMMAEFSWYEDPEKTVRDYVKRLMSRIVFLQFIQKKGWLGVPVDKEWGEGDKEFLQHLYEKYENKDNFIDGILELLFEDINHKRENDIANFILGRNIKVPYLNGGLFERDSVDERTFRLPRVLMDKMMNFFSSYNFTIDENDPDDAEIGVDPEMLGRIFENLLEDNKDKGAFYTPKEIVQYMCQESLIAYLQKEQSDADAAAIRTFVTTYDASVLNDHLKHDVDVKLKNVKICDPAIGSGAFPMGLLKELFACRSAIEGVSEDNAAEIKKHIIKNNIYGVDIEKGAVEIARLRFWLSIIVDEKTPQALPNMDFKIMEGNSLIPTFMGKYIDLNDRQRHINSARIANCKKRLFDLQNVYYSAESECKSELLINIKHLILEIVKLQLDYEHQLEIQNSAKTIDMFSPVIDETRIDEEKARIVGICADMQGTLSDATKQISERAELVLPFFDWSIMFSDIFANIPEQSGFDIIISNPPYIKELDNKKVFDSLSGSEMEKKYHAGKMDYWYYFLHKSIELSSENAIICFITSRYWIKNKGAKKLIKSVKQNLTFKKILDIGSLKVFDNVVGHHMVSLFERPVSSAPCLYYKVAESIENIPVSNYETERVIRQANIISKSFEINIEEGAGVIYQKTLDDYCDVSQGVVEASDKISSKMYKKNPDPAHHVGEGIFVLTAGELDLLGLNSEEKAIMVKYIGDGDVKKYVIIPEHTKYLIYSDKTTKDRIRTDPNLFHIKDHLDKMSSYITSSNRPYGLHRPREKGSFESIKIVAPSMFKHPGFAFDDKQYYCGMSFNTVTLKKEVKNKNFLYYILGLLNSNFADKWFYTNAKHRGVGVDVGVSKLREFPIPENADINEIVQVVKSMIELSSNGIDYTKEEAILNSLIDKIYSDNTDA